MTCCQYYKYTKWVPFHQHWFLSQCFLCADPDSGSVLRRCCTRRTILCFCSILSWEIFSDLQFSLILRIHIHNYILKTADIVRIVWHLNIHPFRLANRAYRFWFSNFSSPVPFSIENRLPDPSFHLRMGGGGGNLNNNMRNRTSL